jgi:rare lipoprotein A
MRRALLLSLVIAIAWCGCGRKKHARVVTPPVPPRIGDTEEGVASWYGHPYHGRVAADGEIYDMEKMVAAHRTLPFNTWVRVRNLANDMTAEVRIIDRGPFVNGRIIDLSHAAAQQIALIGPGIAKVRIEVIQAPPSAPAHFAVQVGAFRQRESAERIRRTMETQYGAARVVKRDGSPAVWRVLVGDEPSEDGAASLAGRIRDGGEKSAFVVRLDS